MPRFRLALIQLLVIPVILTIFTSLPALAVDVTFTADNAYQLWYGTATSVANPPISPAVVNTLAAEIGSCGLPGPESYQNISNADGGYIYIVAWSDESTTQGVLGQFVAGTSTTYTGIGGWEVYATGMPISPVTATPPTLAEVNTQIALANANGGDPDISSVGWVTQAPHPIPPAPGGKIGLLASGETNALNSGNFGIVCQTYINPGARWMWYNRNNDGSGNPFGPPKPLGEYLIFRLPVSQIVNPTAFYANKDIKNMTGVTAFGVEIEVAGHHAYNDIYRDPATPVFTLDATGANDKLRYTGGPISAGAVVHVGFWTNDPVINMLGVTMLDAGGASIGCALQLNTGIHANVDLTFHNTVTNCTASPIWVGDGEIEYHFDRVPLKDLVAGGARTPFRTDTLKMAATLIAPSGTLIVPIPDAPKGARWMVAHLGIGSTAALGETEDWLQVPVEKTPIGQLGNISSRLHVGTGSNVMIAGFIIQGSVPKQVVIRAAGPSLTPLGVPNALANPRLELHDTTNTIGTNNDWQTTQIGGVITSDQVAAIQGSGLAPLHPLESAMIATLAPGPYTAIVEGVSAGTGVGIVEVFDFNLTGGSILANISTRGFVQTGDNVMIGGFIAVTAPTRVIIRAIGPSLTQFGVPDALANPTLELRDANGALLFSNNDWEDNPAQAAELIAAGLAPTNALESGIAATLPPGLYTALVAGLNNGTGVGLVEVYDRGAP
ncbi:MAG TPA: hypothetical protein VGW39_09285 [Chthoniobacterales bacterium]|nr:hypothetical protein [Chthoniobacterales bacterium]